MLLTKLYIRVYTYIRVVSYSVFFDRSNIIVSIWLHLKLLEHIVK